MFLSRKQKNCTPTRQQLLSSQLSSSSSIMPREHNISLSMPQMYYRPSPCQWPENAGSQQPAIDLFWPCAPFQQPGPPHHCPYPNPALSRAAPPDAAILSLQPNMSLYSGEGDISLSSSPTIMQDNSYTSASLSPYEHGQMYAQHQNHQPFDVDRTSHVPLNTEYHPNDLLPDHFTITTMNRGPLQQYGPASPCDDDLRPLTSASSLSFHPQTVRGRESFDTISTDTSEICITRSSSSTTTASVATVVVTAAGTEEHRFACVICNRTYKHRKSLTRHTNHKHGKINSNGIRQQRPLQFSCDDCSRPFSRKDSRVRHARNNICKKVMC